MGGPVFAGYPHLCEFLVGKPTTVRPTDRLANNEWFAQKIVFFAFFLTVFPFFTRAIGQLLFTKVCLWVIRSGRSWQKSHHELFAQVAHDKRATGAIHYFSWVNSSFTLSLIKKRTNRSENPVAKLFMLHKVSSKSPSIWNWYGRKFRPKELSISVICSIF